MSTSESKVKKPTVLVRHNNDITVSWKDVFETEEETMFILQILDELKCWKTIYWGKKTESVVQDLASCTCYNFRIRKESSNDWIEFKGATEDGPYCVLHVTRALRLGKAALLRKIAQKRPVLLELPNKENKTPLLQSIEKGDVQMVTLLISLGANVNTPVVYVRRSPLMLAVYLGELQIASILINKGADVKARDINGLNILHYAVDANRVNSVQFAIDNGINVNGTDNKGWSPLLRAAILKANQEIVDLLIKCGSNINLTDINGFNFHKHCEIGKINYTLKIKNDRQ